MEITRNWMTAALTGVFAFIAGCFFVFLPLKSLPVLAYTFAAFAVAAGAIMLLNAFRRIVRARRGWVLALQGVLALVAGILIFAWMGAGTLTSLAFLYIVGIWAIVAGAVQLAASMLWERDNVFRWVDVALGAFTALFGIALVAGPPAANGVAISWLLGVYLLGFGFIQLAQAALLYRPLARRTAA